MIPLVYATKNVEWTDERILYARIAFGVVQAAILAVLLVVGSKIKKAANHAKIDVPKAPPSPWSQSYVKNLKRSIKSHQNSITFTLILRADLMNSLIFLPPKHKSNSDSTMATSKFDHFILISLLVLTHI